MSESRPHNRAVASVQASTWSMAERALNEADQASNGVQIRAFADSLRSYCESCAHSRFIHSDDGYRCLYSECLCSRFKQQAAG